MGWLMIMITFIDLQKEKQVWAGIKVILESKLFQQYLAMYGDQLLLLYHLLTIKHPTIY